MMFSSRAVRVRGGVMLACGVFLVGFIAAIPTLTRMFMAPSFRFALPDDAVEAVLLLAPIGLVAGFGLIAAVQAVGRWRPEGQCGSCLSMLLAIIMAITLVFGIATLVLDGDAPRPMPPRSVLP